MVYKKRLLYGWYMIPSLLNWSKQFKSSKKMITLLFENGHTHVGKCSSFPWKKLKLFLEEAHAVGGKESDHAVIRKIFILP